MPTNYTYDDPTIKYDEICFFYDGAGYDSVCLAGPTTVFLRRGGSRRHKKREEYPFINIFISVLSLDINDEDVEIPTEYIRFSGENTPVSIIVNKFQFETQNPYILGEFKKAIKSSKETTAIIEFVEHLEGKSDEDLEAQNLETHLKTTKIEMVEPFNPLSVKLEIVEEEKITIKTALFKENDKNIPKT